MVTRILYRENIVAYFSTGNTHRILVWLLSGMYAQMCFEVTFESKGFFAHWVWANEFFLSLVLLEMKLELRLTCKALTAAINGTCVRFNFHMSL